MDTINRDINQSDDEERPKKTVLQRLFDLLASWKLKLRGWFRKLNDWAGTYKPSIELAAVVVALLTVLFIYLQVDGINKQTMAIVDQNKAIRDQNEAIWSAQRPVLNISDADARKDIVSFKGLVDYGDSTWSDSSIFYFLNYKLENGGNSHALIASKIYQLYSEDHSSFDTTLNLRLTIPPQKSFAMKIPLPFRIDRLNVIRVTVTYDWQRRPYAFDSSSFPYKLDKYYRVSHEDNHWRLHFLSENEYLELKSMLMEKSKRKSDN